LSFLKACYLISELSIQPHLNAVLIPGHAVTGGNGGGTAEPPVAEVLGVDPVAVAGAVDPPAVSQ